MTGEADGVTVAGAAIVWTLVLLCVLPPSLLVAFVLVVRVRVLLIAVGNA
jgi:hypothetical protein